MDLTDRISFSKKHDLAGQNKIFKDLRELYKGSTSLICLCWKLIGHETSIPLSYGHGNWIPKSRISKSFDLAGQNKALKDPGQVYTAKTINICRCLAHF